MLGAAAGMLGMGASRKGLMSCLLKAGRPCTQPATLAAARVACRGVGDEVRGGGAEGVADLLLR